MSSGSYRKEYKKAQTAAKATVKAAISMSLRNTDISYCLLLSRTSVGSPVNTLRWNRESDEMIMSLSNDSSVYSGVSDKGERTSSYPRSEWWSKSALASTALDSFTVT